ncbi:HNH endonuclease [Stenotrophomonas maltophilia]|uniref:HNH endonuclease n=1 Tax=Stenotrophomonas maltophilia TaxID=40324 RepID=UPI003D02F87C
MTTKRLKSIRTSAFHAQSGRCFYCGLPMWLAAPSELGLKPSKARAFQCTAEHLVAQQDGGRDVSGNVVAAHARCNQCRHKRKGPAPSPDAFRALVMRRVNAGKWWPQNQKFWQHQSTQ